MKTQAPVSLPVDHGPLYNLVGYPESHNCPQTSMAWPPQPGLSAYQKEQRPGVTNKGELVIVNVFVWRLNAAGKKYIRGQVLTQVRGLSIQSQKVLRAAMDICCRLDCWLSESLPPPPLPAVVNMISGFYKPEEVFKKPRAKRVVKKEGTP